MVILQVNKRDKVKISALIECYHPDQEPEPIEVFRDTRKTLTTLIAEAVEKNQLTVRHRPSTL